MSDDKAQQGATAVAEKNRLVEGDAGGNVDHGIRNGPGSGRGGVHNVVDSRRNFGEQKVTLQEFAKILGVTYQAVLKMIKTGAVKTAGWENIIIIDTNANASVIQAYTECLGAVQLARELGVSTARVRRMAASMYILPTHYRGATGRNPVWDKVSADAIRRAFKKTLDGAGDSVASKG